VQEVPLQEQLTLLLFGLWSFDFFPGEHSPAHNQEMMRYCLQLLPFLKPKKLFFTKSTDFLSCL
jgi:hypothetical protein